MKHFVIFWTKTAIIQRNFVFEYWDEHNKSNRYSKKLNRKIKNRVGLLKTNPLLGKSTDYKNTRVLFLGHYSIFYQIVELKVIITGFWDNRQDQKKLLDFLKKDK